MIAQGYHSEHSYLCQPQRCRAAGEEADLWNSIGTVMDTAPEERKLDVTVGGTPEPQALRFVGMGCKQ